MPPVEPAQAEEYLQMLFDAGPAQPGMGGPTVLSWQELAAYRQQAGVYLRPAEAHLLRTLSSLYCSATAEMRKPHARSPWPESPCEAAARRGRAVISAFDRIFASLKTSRAGQGTPA